MFCVLLPVITKTYAMSAFHLSKKKQPDVEVDLELPQFLMRGYTYRDVRMGGRWQGSSLAARLSSADPNLALDVSAEAELDGKRLASLQAAGHVKRLAPAALGWGTKVGDAVLSARFAADVTRRGGGMPLGELRIDDFAMTSASKDYHLDQLLLCSAVSAGRNRLSLSSDFARAELEGPLAPGDLKKCGLALLGKCLPGLTDANARYLEVQTELDGSPWRLASVYLPNGNPPYNNPADKSKLAYKLQWFDAFLAHAAELQKLSVPVVLGGDFNVILTPKDVYDSRPFVHDALFLPEVRKRLRMLEYAGFYDAFRTLHPDEPGYTFWDYTGNALAADFGMRIDYLFLNAPAADRLTACAVDKSPRLGTKPSDHTALTAEFAK